MNEMVSVSDANEQTPVQAPKRQGSKSHDRSKELITYVIVEVLPTSLGVINTKHSSVPGSMVIAYEASTV